MVLRVAARAKVDARRLVRQAASSRDRVPATKPAVTATRASRPALRRDNVRLSGSIVAVGIALALWAADMQAQGDGGYKLVPNWVKMPGHVPAFGPGRKFLPPGEREADQDAKRKAGFIEMVEAQPGIGGIAVDSRDRVYVLQRRAELPIMVFDSTGEFPIRRRRRHLFSGLALRAGGHRRQRPGRGPREPAHHQVQQRARQDPHGARHEGCAWVRRQALQPAHARRGLNPRSRSKHSDPKLSPRPRRRR